MYDEWVAVRMDERYLLARGKGVEEDADGDLRPCGRVAVQPG